MKKVLLSIVIAVVAFAPAFCQQLLPAMDRFSDKKPGYLITMKGERIEFTLKDLDRKKGLIVNVEGKTLDGKKFEMDAAEIKELALAPSDWAKLGSTLNATQSVLTATKTDINKLNPDLVYFFQENIGDKKNTTALLQLLNPQFSSKIRIYHDPFAAETAGVGIGGIQVTGGIDKSYYVKVGEKTRRIFKRDYDKDFPLFFNSCETLTKKYKDFAWRDFPDHVFFFENDCK